MKSTGIHRFYVDNYFLYLYAYFLVLNDPAIFHFLSKISSGHGRTGRTASEGLALAKGVFISMQANAWTYFLQIANRPQIILNQNQKVVQKLAHTATSKKKESCETESKVDRVSMGEVATTIWRIFVFFFGERSNFISSSGHRRLYFHEWRSHE